MKHTIETGLKEEFRCPCIFLNGEESDFLDDPVV
jgi:hypothetical protein